MIKTYKISKNNKQKIQNQMWIKIKQKETKRKRNNQIKNKILKMIRKIDKIPKTKPKIKKNYHPLNNRNQ